MGGAKAGFSFAVFIFRIGNVMTYAVGHSKPKTSHDFRMNFYRKNGCGVPELTRMFIPIIANGTGSWFGRSSDFWKTFRDIQFQFFHDDSLVER